MRPTALVSIAGLCLACAPGDGDRLPERPATAERRPREPRARRCEEVDAANRCTLWGVSLVELIARPELYDGRRVRVIGFVNFEFEGNGLYLSREDWVNGVYQNGVWVDPELELPAGVERDTTAPSYRPNRRHALVEGTFRADDGGHLGLWSGSIRHVTRLMPWGEAPGADVPRPRGR